MTQLEQAPVDEQDPVVDVPTVTHRGSVSGLIVAGVLAVLIPVITAVDVAFPGRAVLAVWYLLAVPGVPLAALLKLPSRLATATLAIALSIAIQLLLSEATLLAGVFHAIITEVAASVVALVALGYLAARTEIFRSASVRRHARQSARDFTHAVRAGRVTLVGCLIALVLWIIGVRSVDPATMNAYGLISVILKTTIPIALAIVVGLAVLELRRPALRVEWIAAVTVTFFLIVQGTAAAVEPAASLNIAWLHVGFSDYIRVHGAVLRSFDARFSWPGFFALLANLTTAAGLRDAGGLLRWAPLAQNLLMILPVLMMARKLCSTQRLAWIAVILYAAGNWYQQDYLSPQAMSLFLGFSTLALVLWSAQPAPSNVRREAGASWLSTLSRRRRTYAAQIPGLTPPTYLWLGAALIAILLSIVVSHQLTPVALVLFLGLTTLTRWTRFPDLWKVLALATVVWIFFGATDYWSGHLNQIFGGVGNVGSSLNQGVGARLAGNPQHQQMLYVRIAMSGVYLVLAMAGLFVIRRDPKWRLLAGLCVTPFLLIAVQSYGGEVVLRSFVFALPALAIVGAEACGVIDLRWRSLAGSMGVLLFVLSMTVIGARGANAPFERITPTQLEAVDALNAVAPAGSIVGLWNANNPLGRLAPEKYTERTIKPGCADAKTSATHCLINSDPKYLFITSSEAAYGVLVESRKVGWSDAIVNQLIAASTYSVLFEADDAIVLERVKAVS